MPSVARAAERLCPARQQPSAHARQSGTPPFSLVPPAPPPPRGTPPSFDIGVPAAWWQRCFARARVCVREHDCQPRAVRESAPSASALPPKARIGRPGRMKSLRPTDRRSRGRARPGQWHWCSLGADSQGHRWAADARALAQSVPLPAAALAIVLLLVVWGVWSFVADKGGLVASAHFLSDVAVDAALERSTWAGAFLAALGVGRSHLSGSKTAMVGGAPVRSGADAALPAHVLARSSAGWLPGSAVGGKGVAWWASDSEAALAGAGGVCIASVEVDCVGSRSGGLGRALWTQAQTLVLEGAPQRHWPGTNVTVIVVDSADGAPATLSAAALGRTLETPGEPAPRLASPGCSPLSADAPRVEQSAAALWPERFRLVRVAAKQSAAWRKGAPALLEAAALLDFVRNFPGTCRHLHVPDFRGIGALVLQARAAGEAGLDDVRVTVQTHGTDASLSLGYLLDRPRKGPADVVQNALERAALRLADDTQLLTSAQLPDIAAVAGAGFPRRPWVAGNIASAAAPPAGAGASCRSGAPSGAAAGHGAKCGRSARLVFYGRLKFLKGLHLFAAALHRLGRRGLAAIGVTDVSLLGHKALDGGELARITASMASLGLGVELLTHNDAAGAGAALKRLAASQEGALVVLPSLHENQPFALADAAAAGACFVASDIWGHRSMLRALWDEADQSLLDRVLFPPSPQGLATALRRAAAGRVPLLGPPCAEGGGPDGRAAFVQRHRELGLLPGSVGDGGSTAASAGAKRRSGRDRGADAPASPAAPAARAIRPRVLVVVATTLPGAEAAPAVKAAIASVSAQQRRPALSGRAAEVMEVEVVVVAGGDWPADVAGGGSGGDASSPCGELMSLLEAGGGARRRVRCVQPAVVHSSSAAATAVNVALAIAASSPEGAATAEGGQGFCRAFGQHSGAGAADAEAPPDGPFELAVALDADAGQVLVPTALGSLLRASRANPEAAVVAGWGAEYAWTSERSPADAALLLVGGRQLPGAGPAAEAVPFGEAAAGGAAVLGLRASALAAWERVATRVALPRGSEASCLVAVPDDAWDGCGVEALLAALQWGRVGGAGALGPQEAAGSAPTGQWLVVVPQVLAWRGEARPAGGAAPWLGGEGVAEVRARCLLRAARSAAAASGFAPLATWMHYAASLYEASEPDKRVWDPSRS